MKNRRQHPRRINHETLEPIQLDFNAPADGDAGGCLCHNRTRTHSNSSDGNAGPAHAYGGTCSSRHT
jgi:hypothetical protein